MTKEELHNVGEFRQYQGKKGNLILKILVDYWVWTNRIGKFNHNRYASWETPEKERENLPFGLLPWEYLTKLGF